MLDSRKYGSIYISKCSCWLSTIWLCSFWSPPRNLEKWIPLPKYGLWEVVGPDAILYCYFKWLQEMRAPTHVMGFPLHEPQKQDMLYMGICLLTSTPVFFFLQKEATHWGMGERLRESTETITGNLQWLFQIAGAVKQYSILTVRKLKLQISIQHRLHFSCLHFCSSNKCILCVFLFFFVKWIWKSLHW